MNSRNSKRILITPNVAAPYDQRMVKALAEGFNLIGQMGYASTKPLLSEELSRMCKEFDIDVVIEVNKTRNLEYPLPKEIRHISWFQDVFPETLNGFNESFHDSDILYALSDPVVLGLNIEMPCYVGTLFTGVDSHNLNFDSKKITQDLDFSLCGGLPPPVDIHPNLLADIFYWFDKMLSKIPVFGQNNVFKILRQIAYGRYYSIEHVSYAEMMAILNVVEVFYRPLRGELDIHELSVAMLNESNAIMNRDYYKSQKPKKVKCDSIHQIIKAHFTHIHLKHL
jgi:hypothetical protein